MTSREVNAVRKYKYTSVRMSKRTSEILRTIARRKHWTLRKTIDKCVLLWAEREDYFNSL